MTPTLESRLIAARDHLRSLETGLGHRHADTIDEVYGLLSDAYQRAAHLDEELMHLAIHSDQLGSILNLRKGEES